MSTIAPIYPVTIAPSPAVKAFEIYALDFLLKPFKAHRFNIALDRVLHKLEVEGFQNNFKNLLNNFGKNTSETEQCITKIPVKQGNKTILLQVSDIRYVCASSYYAEIFLDNKKLVLRESLKNLIKKLDDNSFVRIHRSTIINIEGIKELLHSDYNELDVKMQDNAVFRVSKSYKKAFLQKIGL